MLEPPSNDRARPAANGTGSKMSNGDTTMVLGQTLAHFAHRLLCDALQEATAAYWRRRAEQFAKVGTPACDAIAQACRNRAAVSAFEDFDDLAALALREVAS